MQKSHSINCSSLLPVAMEDYVKILAQVFFTRDFDLRHLGKLQQPRQSKANSLMVFFKDLREWTVIKGIVKNSDAQREAQNICLKSKQEGTQRKVQTNGSVQANGELLVTFCYNQVKKGNTNYTKE